MNDLITIKQNQILKRLFLSNIISTLADWVIIVGVQVMLVFTLDASVWQVSMLFTCSLLPKIILTPFIGNLIDRGYRLIFLRIGRILAAIISIFFIFINDVNLLIILASLVNIVLVSEEPASIGLIRNSVLEEDKLDGVLGIFYLISDAIKIVGPLFASFIIGFFSTNILFIITSFIFIISSIFMFLVPYKEEIEVISNTNMKQKIIGFINLKEIIVIITSNKQLLYVFTVIFFFLFSINTIDASSAVFIHQLTEKSYVQGLFLTSIGLGGAVGALVVINLNKKFNNLNISVLSMIAFGMQLFLIQFINSIPLVLLLSFTIGIFAPGIIIPLEILRQKLVKKEYSSRIAGFTTSINSCAQLLGVTLSGFFMHLITSKGVFVFAGILILALGILGSIISTVINKEQNKKSKLNKNQY